LCIYKDGVFTWSENTRISYGETVKKFLVDDKMNEKVVSSICKLFERQIISLPEKYKFIIPYICSFFTDPSLSNVIRIGSNEEKDFNAYFILYQSLEIPYFMNITTYLLDDLNKIL